MWRHSSSQDYVNLYTCQVDVKWTFNWGHVTLGMYMHIVGARFYHNCAYILNSETAVYITSILNHLVGVQVKGYVHTYTITLYHICIYVCDIIL